MSTLDNLLGLLKTWPAWKRITGAPDEIDALRKRVERLEAAQRTAVPARDQCPKCGALTWRITGNRPDAHFGDMGVSYDRWACGTCAFSRETKA